MCPCVGVSLCSLCVPSDFGGRVRSEVSASCIFPWAVLVATTLMGGRAGIGGAFLLVLSAFLIPAWGVPTCLPCCLNLKPPEGHCPEQTRVRHTWIPILHPGGPRFLISTHLYSTTNLPRVPVTGRAIKKQDVEESSVKEVEWKSKSKEQRNNVN